MTGTRGLGVLLTFARRGEDETIRGAVEALRELAPEVVAIGTEVSAPVLRDLGLGEVVTIDGSTPARAAVAAVRGRRPEAAAIVYGEARGDGHLKLEGLALLVGAPRVLRMRPGRPVQTVGRGRLALLVLLKGGEAAGRLAVGVVVCSIAWGWLRLAQRRAGVADASRD